MKFEGVGFQSLGFNLWGAGFGAWHILCGIQGLGSGVQVGFGVQDLDSMVWGLVSREEILWWRLSGEQGGGLKVPPTLSHTLSHTLHTHYTHSLG